MGAASDYGLLELAKSIETAARLLGLNNAATPMGALEVVSKSIIDAGDAIKSGLDNLADAVREVHEEEETS